MNFPYQILELELESLFIFYRRWDEKNFHESTSIDALHVDVNEVLPPNWAEILV